MGCEPTRKGSCGESFSGSFKCSFKTNCTSKNECICILKAECMKSKHPNQEFVERITTGKISENKDTKQESKRQFQFRSMLPSKTIKSVKGKNISTVKVLLNIFRPF